MKKIMVVDDDPGIQEVLKHMLKSEGFQVLSAKSGAECLEMLESDIPDYILLDIMMPHMDGWAVLKEIKKNEKLKETPVSMLTVKSLDIEKLESEDIKELVDYIKKPFTKKDLMETLKQVL